MIVVIAVSYNWPRHSRPLLAKVGGVCAMGGYDMVMHQSEAHVKARSAWTQEKDMNEVTLMNNILHCTGGLGCELG